ncbi:DUF6404 family protein [Vibrio sp. TRT 1302]|uniref:DUF6404 family protein n=1 Tax=Vibrio sp. TRT 1302 TaxID=3418504 RepID=UPI003CE67F7A
MFRLISVRFLRGRHRIQGFWVIDYETKLQLAHKELSDKGVWKPNYNPPLVKLLRKLGLCFPPTCYQSFYANVILCVAFFESDVGNGSRTALVFSRFHR